VARLRSTGGASKITTGAGTLKTGETNALVSVVTEYAGFNLSLVTITYVLFLRITFSYAINAVFGPLQGHIYK
jgi:hypothetical protein